MSKKAARNGGNDLGELRTLFVRGIPFTTSEEDLQTFFSKYGDVLYAKICVDKATGKSQGNGFVKFRTKEHAQKVLDEQQTFEETLGLKSEHKFAPVEGNKLSIEGRRLLVTLAVSRDEANKLKKDSKKKGNNTGGRGFELLALGYLDEKSREFQRLSPREKQKRKVAVKNRNLKMQNCNFFVNPKSLTITNLPGHATAVTLRDGIVNQLLDSPVGRDVLEERKSEIMEAAELSGKVKMKRLAQCALGKVRVMKNEGSRGGATGASKCKGFAFVEFVSHEVALVVLQLLNDKVTIYSGNRLMVDFTIENKKALWIQEERLRKAKLMLQTRTTTTTDETTEC